MGLVLHPLGQEAQILVDGQVGDLVAVLVDCLNDELCLDDLVADDALFDLVEFGLALEEEVGVGFSEGVVDARNAVRAEEGVRLQLPLLVLQVLHEELVVRVTLPHRHRPQLGWKHPVSHLPILLLERKQVGRTLPCALSQQELRRALEAFAEDLLAHALVEHLRRRVDLSPRVHVVLYRQTHS